MNFCKASVLGVRRASASIVLSILCSFLLYPCTSVLAEEVQKPIAAGDKFQGYALEDQHGVKHDLGADTRLVLVSFDMDLSKSVHAWLSTKEPNFLEQHNAEYVVDITEMPGLISYLFAKPKMRKYPFEILLADDVSFSPKFPKEESKLVVISLLPDKTIKEIRFLSSMEEVDKDYFQQPAELNVKVTNAATQADALKK